MTYPIWLWVTTACALGLALLADLFHFHRHPHVMSPARAARRSAGWIAVAVAVAGVIWLLQDGAAAAGYLAGYLTEKAISVENVFVFALILRYLAVPADLQPRLLLIGLTASIVLRGGFIAGGRALLDALDWAPYVLGALLVTTALPIVRHRRGTPAHPGPLWRALGRLVPLTEGYQGPRLVGRRGGRRAATPLALALGALLLTDLIFAVDSIPAVYAVTDEPFLVFCAGAFALLGIKGLYFLFSAALDRLPYLNLGLAAVLAMVGAKMLLAPWWKIPTLVLLGAMATVLAAAAAASWAPLRTARRPGGTSPGADG
jgi:tellurite resistance protein TerC